MAIRRIVKMTFKAECCADFEAYFSEIKNQVGNQPGCHGVKLLRDIKDSGVYFTYSIWDDETALNAYRYTPLFAVVWPKVKVWFASKPEAWSTEISLESTQEK
ncbi:MAG: antibiotic biosynthesis monooxygenase [Crocinitomix sp.]|nr:antibiotic biosynthesis monooxygenase [Crocinitomix sp.]